MMSGMSGSSLPQRHYCLGRTDICCLSKVMRVNEKCVCVLRSWQKKKKKKNPDTRSFDSILVLLKSVLIFHHRGGGGEAGVYGTDSIRRISDGHNLIFQVQMFVLRKKRRTWTLYEKEITLWTHAWPLFLTNGGRDAGRFSRVQSRALDAQACWSFDRVPSVPWRAMEHFVELSPVMRRLRLANRAGGRGVSLTKYFWMVSFFSDSAADRSGDAKSIQKTHCHKTEKWVIHGVVFIIFYCYSCKKKNNNNKAVKLRRGQLHYQKHAVLENLSICIWIMNTLKMLQTCSSDYFWNALSSSLIKRPVSFLPSPTSFSLVLSCCRIRLYFSATRTFAHTHGRARSPSLVASLPTLHFEWSA